MFRIIIMISKNNRNNNSYIRRRIKILRKINLNRKEGRRKLVNEKIKAMNLIKKY